ncbi:hypothetical protein BU17DRAFT_62733 [Hysterangium stoloniferum]|nr:hypothetical protein BU17DRAFT_62733 [Hysterangium stoloniferum]
MATLSTSESSRGEQHSFRAQILQLLDGRVSRIVSSYDGTGQYSQGATSACGLAALNAVRIVLGSDKMGRSGVKLLEHMTNKETIEEIIAICARWTSQLHLEADELASLPLFQNPLVHDGAEYNEANVGNLKGLFEHLKEMSQSSSENPVPIAVVITRPPEIFTVFYIPLRHQLLPGVFAIFDSHPRPACGATGSSFILFSTMDETSEYVASLIQIEKGLLSGDLQWQAQLLGHYSGHFFRARSIYDIAGDHMASIYDANMEILEFRARLKDSERENNELKREIAALREQQARVARLTKPPPPKKTSGSTQRQFLNVGGNTKWREQSNRKDSASSSATPHEQASYKPSERRPEKTDIEALDFRAALIMQQEFDEEDRMLRNQGALLKQALQTVFTCKVCFETYPEDSVARIGGCGHQLCRDCAKGYLTTKMEEHRYPILCPICQVEQDVVEHGVITEELVAQLGLSEKQYGDWIELELSQFSIILDCPGCRRSTFVDLKDHADMKLLSCPLPDCRHVWCKECRCSVEPNAAHSCDGSVELDTLMQSRGWVYCPGCKTPTEKHSGCNHMTCPARGCNTHFCYICKNPIVRSALPQTIEVALSEHYSRCNLFEH